MDFTPEQRMKIAEMEYRHKKDLADSEMKCCMTRIEGNNRVLDQIAINNQQKSCCCNSLADAEYCCCKKR